MNERSAGPRSASMKWVVALFATVSNACDWKALDAIDPYDGSAMTDAELAGSGPADVVASGDQDDTEIADAASGDAPFEAGLPTPGAPCSAPGPYIDAWNFDTDVQNWSLSVDTGVDAGLSWASAAGDPSPGALEVDVDPAPGDASSPSGVWLKIDGTFGDLSARTVTAWVWLDVGPSPQFKVFTQSAPMYGWEDNGTLALPLRAWTCVSLPISTPSYEQAWYDETQVITVGFEMLNAAPFRVYVDSVHVR